MFGREREFVLCVLISFLLILSGPAWGQRPQLSSPPMILKASIQSPLNVPLTQEFWWWLDEVEKRSGGRVKFERYPGETLAKAAEQLDALESGMADVALFNTIYTPGKLPLSTLAALPFAFRHGWVNATSYFQLVQGVPEVKSEFAKYQVRVVSSFATGPSYVFSTKPIKKFADFKGRKIIGTGPVAELLKAAGAAPLAIVITESYEALQRGTADGAVFGPSQAGSYNVDEVCKFLLKLPLGGVCGPVGMNVKAWNKLPPDIQKIIEDLQPEHAQAVYKIYQLEGDGKYMNRFKTRGVEITEPSGELMAEMRQIAQQIVWGKWANDQEKRKLPGKKVMEEYLKLLDKNSAANPLK